MRLWPELDLGPVTAIVPYLVDHGPKSGPASEDRVSGDLARLCASVVQLDFEPEAPAIDRHVAVADEILARTTLLVATFEGPNGGHGGVEDIVASTRARGGLVRYVAMATLSD